MKKNFLPGVVTAGLFLSSLLVLTSSSAAAFFGGRSAIDLASAVDEASREFGVPAFHAADVAEFSDWSGQYYEGSAELKWIDFGMYKLMHLRGGSVPDLLKLARSNLELLPDVMVDAEKLSGKVILNAAGAGGKVFVQQFEKLCHVSAEWNLGREVRVSLSTGEKPVNMRFACEVFVWVISAQGIKFEKSATGDSRRFVLVDGLVKSK